MTPPLRPTWLTGEHMYLRAMVAADKEHAAAWFDEVWPINAARAEAVLKDEHKADRTPRLALVRNDGDEIVGSVEVGTRDGYRRCSLVFHMAPWLESGDADALRAEALRLVVPWLRDQVEVMVVTVHLAADATETVAAAEALGMTRSVQLREWVARPGHRVDKLIYQALNPRWEVRDA
jgi:RimJ/RimL family protein N-acetyltransferase